MKRIYITLSVTLLLLWMLRGSTVSASHFMGGSITYEMTGKTMFAGSPLTAKRTFKIQLKFYRDCVGAPLSSTDRVYFLPSVNGQIKFLDLQRVSSKDVTPVCPGMLSTCNPGWTVPYGVQEYIFEGSVTVDVTTPHPPITIQYSSCCRNNAINTIAAPGDWYISSILDPNYDNSSPAFRFDPVFFISKCEPFTYNPGAVDAEGDSLVFEMVDCQKPLTRDATSELVLATQSVGYKPPFSGANPVTSGCPIVFDPKTGALSFLPVKNEVSIYNYRISEYRNGLKIGEINRDIQIQIVREANNNPRFIKPACSNYTFSCNGAVPVACDTTVCPNQLMVTFIEAHDLDSNNVSMVMRSTSPVTFVNVSSPATPHRTKWRLEYQPTTADIGKSIIVYLQVKDDGCALEGQSFFSYRINVANCNVTVPLELLEFVGKNTPSGNLISWKSADESRVSKYILERSSEGSQYEPLHGASPLNSPVSSYQYLDKDVTGASLYYYRLRVVEKDNSFSYSNTVIVSVPAAGSAFRIVSVQPNPSGGNFVLRLGGSAREQVLVSLADVYGRKVYESAVNVEEGISNVPLSLDYIGKGMYLLSVTRADGELQVTRVVKQ
jgi:hypothetical protein